MAFRKAIAEWWTGSIPEPEIRAGLRLQTERELARRSVSGALIYFLMSLVLAATTPYYSDHPALLVSVGFLVLLFGLSRTIAAVLLLRRPLGAARHEHLVVQWTTYATVITWGPFCAWTVHLYADQWTSMFVLLNTAALAAGACSSMAPDIALACRCLAILVMPTIAVSIAAGGTRLWAVGFMTTVYLAFLFVQATGNWRAFSQATIAAERERIRGSADRKRAERERVSLVTAIEQAAEEILITDVHGNIQYSNPSFERATGYLRSEVIGRNPRFLKSGVHDAEFYRNLWGTITSGGVWTGRMTNRRKDGSLYQTTGTISPIHDDSGKLAGFVSARHDVTEQLQLESRLRQAQKMESIGRLAGGVAHDFNNLLTIIIGYSTALEEQLTPNDPSRQIVEEIRKAGERAASLTQQLLVFSRQQIIEPKPVNLNLLVADMRQMLQRLVGEDIEVTTTLAPHLGMVMADPGQMSQILMNLAANARDAMPTGGKLVLSTANVPAGGTPAGDHTLLACSAVLLSVSDTGTGMSDETRQRIFEPFFTTKEQGHGTGLGLATVYGIVQQNGGWINVWSEPGKGSTFRVYLPQAEASAPVPESGDFAAVARFRGSETVLVVEDQSEVRGLIVKVLESSGFEVLSAVGGNDALSRAERHHGRIDLLLTDVIMPDMNGKDVAEKLVLARPEMKVLFISGYSAEIIARRGIIDSPVAYLPKPFTPDALIAKVREVLGANAIARGA